MLGITGGRGFHLTFENGWTASVQFGVGNYCQHHYEEFTRIGEERQSNWDSYDAEVARWPSKGEDLDVLDGSNTVKGWLSADEVLAFLNETAAKEAAR